VVTAFEILINLVESYLVKVRPIPVEPKPESPKRANPSILYSLVSKVKDEGKVMRTTLPEFKGTGLVNCKL
jgi:hypothetical protein